MSSAATDTTADGWTASALDVVVAVASAAAITITTSVAAEPTSRSSTVPAFVLGAVMGGMLLLRRRRPVGVLIVSLVVVMGYNLTDFPSVSPVWLLLVPLYTAARYGQPVIGAAVGGSTILISVGWLLNSPTPLLELLDGALREATVLAVVLIAGTALRQQELFAHEFEARLAAERRQQDREATRRILEDRLQIARELHDVTAHTLAVVGVQLNLARELVDEDPEAARDLLETTRRINEDAIGELAAAVRLLRADGTAPDLPRDPMPDETQLEGLLDRATESGLTATYEVHGDRRPIPSAIGLTLYRIAQESLTNVLRHANAGDVRVVVRYDPDGIGLEVVDDGPAAPGAGSPSGSGFGLAGMRERATSVGGVLTAEPVPEGGFAVRAWLPSPAGHATADHAPADHAPADHAPADHAPADHAPRRHAPADQASGAWSDATGEAGRIGSRSPAVDRRRGDDDR